MAERKKSQKKQNSRISDKAPKNMPRTKSEPPVRPQSSRSAGAPRADKTRNAPAGQPQRSAQNGTPRSVPPKQQRRQAQPDGRVRTDGKAAPNRQTVPNGQTVPNRHDQPPRPVDPKARKAVSRAMLSKNAPQRKRRYRGGNYILYYILAAIVLVIVMIVLSNTVLFNCNEIEVLGNVRYTAEEIIGYSGLKPGDNLLHTNTRAAEDEIMNSLAYIDGVRVKRSFPTKFIITVSEAEKWYGIRQNGVIAVISRRGKIIEQGNSEGLVIVKGYDAESIETGGWLKSKTEGKSDIPEAIFTAAEKAGLDKINEVDMTDKFSITVTVDNRVILELGPATKVESKLRVAAAFIKNELGAEDSVTVMLTNPEKFAVRYNPRQPSSSSSTGSSSPIGSSSPAASSGTPEVSEPPSDEASSAADTQESPEEVPAADVPLWTPVTEEPV